MCRERWPCTTRGGSDPSPAPGQQLRVPRAPLLSHGLVYPCSPPPAPVSSRTLRDKARPAPALLPHGPSAQDTLSLRLPCCAHPTSPLHLRSKPATPWPPSGCSHEGMSILVSLRGPHALDAQ